MFTGRARKARGFTLIELLVVVLILAILMAVALPAYLGAVADSEKKTCRANLQTIANAVQAHKVRLRAPSYTTNFSDLTADLGSTPQCPSGGNYTIKVSGTVKDENGTTDLTIPNGGFGVECDKHFGYVPGVSNR
jgi:prepilin-type N-terminal cleavage/methylation domain-containing protein